MRNLGHWIKAYSDGTIEAIVRIEPLEKQKVEEAMFPLQVRRSRMKMFRFGLILHHFYIQSGSLKH